MNALNTLTLSTVRTESVILCRLRDTTVALATREGALPNGNERWEVTNIRGLLLGHFTCANEEAERCCIETVSDFLFECLTGLPEGCVKEIED